VNTNDTSGPASPCPDWCDFEDELTGQRKHSELEWVMPLTQMERRHKKPVGASVWLEHEDGDQQALVYLRGLPHGELVLTVEEARVLGGIFREMPQLLSVPRSKVPRYNEVPADWTFDEG
jgi:hypothetical protein